MKISKNDQGEWLMYPETEQEREMTNEISDQIMRHQQMTFSYKYAYLPSEFAVTDTPSTKCCMGIWLNTGK